MMKKNKYIIALLLLSNLFTGCEIGFLDNEAFSDLTREGYYEKLSDYEAALVGCYYYISGRGTTKEGTYADRISCIGRSWYR